jgi:hypothetical protein
MKSVDLLMNRRRKLKVDKIQCGTAWPQSQLILSITHYALKGTTVWSGDLQPPGGRVEDRESDGQDTYTDIYHTKWKW